MNRRLIFVFSISVLLAGLITFLPAQLTVQAQSAGCASVQGLSGLLSEGFSRSTGPQAFSAGEVITVSSVADGGGSAPIQVVISGPAGIDQTAGGVSFAIPQAGTYTVSLNNTFTSDAWITASCGSAGSGWGGYSDGRLNAHPAENYSLFCQYDRLYIYRIVNNSGEQLAAVPLPSMANLVVGGQLSVTDPYGQTMTIQRNDADAMLLSGNNATNAPSLGTKSFSLAECYARNGGGPVPPVPTPDPNADSDGDGIRNRFDLCPNVAARGMPFGCPDSDGDGVVDPMDRCPGALGSLAARGCPDADGDGVANFEDLCPFLAPVAGMATVSGCPDPDGDGLINSPRAAQLGIQVDDCPQVSGPANNNGCPIQPVIIVVTAPPTMSLFEFAAQQGAYQHLVVPAMTVVESCNLTYIGFCN